MHVEKILFENLSYMLTGAKRKKNKKDVKCRDNIDVHCNQLDLELKDNGYRLLMPKVLT